MPLRYLLYARKSTDREDRQVQSLDDQISVMRDIASRFGMDLITELTESMSAKEPGKRPVFAEMLRMFERGEADALLCWNVNRLSRNPVDSGQIQWLLQKEAIKEIRTVDRVFLPGDNALLFSIETGQANQYIRELVQNVNRGMQSRAERGWCSHMAPEGYRNVGGEVVADPERLPLITRLFKDALAGQTSVPKLLIRLNDEWGYRTKPGRRTPAGKLSRAGFYKILKNPFYSGYFRYCGRLYEGKHPAVITWDEHERVLELLGLRKPAPRTQEFAYSLTVRCGACGRYICGTRKSKLVRSIGGMRDYVYYYCTNSECTGRSKNSITEQTLEGQIADRLRGITVRPEFVEFAKNEIDCLAAADETESETRRATLRAAGNRVRQQMERLLDLRLAGLIDDNEYQMKKEYLDRELEGLQAKERDVNASVRSSWRVVADTLEFAATAHARLPHSDARTKRQLAQKLGASYILQEGQLTIVTSGLLTQIEESYPALEREFDALEPADRCSLSTKKGPVGPIASTWWTIVTAIRTAVLYEGG